MLGSDPGPADADPSDASREHAISYSANGVVSITGGKLTTYRIMAAEVVDAVAERLGTRVARRPPTRNAPLPGGDLAYIDQAVAAAERATADADLANRLVRSYGSRWSAVADEITARRGAERLAGLPYTIGEMRYAVKHEMAYTIADLLMRRTHLAFETRDHGTHSAEQVARGVADLLDWSEGDITAAAEDYAGDVERVFAIES